MIAAHTAWRDFARAALGAAALLGLGAVAFVALLDPYGLRAAPGRPPGPIMDSNQRLSYPQIARGGPFDAAVFGTSTARLLDPADLDRAFGGHFANLAMNAATPDEQLRLAALFLARGTPRAILFALDPTWCAADPPPRTANAFPDWLYTTDAPWGILRQASLRSVTACGRTGRPGNGLRLARGRVQGPRRGDRRRGRGGGGGFPARLAGDDAGHGLLGRPALPPAGGRPHRGGPEGGGRHGGERSGGLLRGPRAPLIRDHCATTP